MTLYDNKHVFRTPIKFPLPNGRVQRDYDTGRMIPVKAKFNWHFLFACGMVGAFWLGFAILIYMAVRNGL